MPNMSKIIIGVHGLGNKPPREILELWWKRSLREGFRRIQKPRVFFKFELAYWTDIIYPEPQDINITDPQHPLYLDEYYFPGRKVREIEPGSLRKKILGYIERQMDKLFLNEDMTLNFSAITDKFLKRYFKDLEAYYAGELGVCKEEQKPLRQCIRERITEIIRKHKGKDILLLSHSMGSIIAYDVLTQMIPDIPIHTFVTLGSPLGMPIIVGRIFAEQKQLHKDFTKVRTPENVTRNWFNFADRDDRIAIDPTMSDDYAENSRQVRAVDMFIFNDYENHGERNPHKIYGYLRTPQLAAVVDEFLDRGKPAFLRHWEAWINRWLSDFIEKHK